MTPFIDPIIALTSVVAAVAAALISRFALDSAIRRSDAKRCEEYLGEQSPSAAGGSTVPAPSSAGNRQQPPAILAVLVLCLSLPGVILAQGGFGGPGLYEIANVKSGKLLDLDHGSPNRVIQLASEGRAADSQVWDVRPAGEGYYALLNRSNGMALEAGGRRNSTPVQAVRFSGEDNQQWRFEAGKDGAAVIVSRLGKTLDIAGGSTEDRATVQTYENNGGENQQFLFRLVSVNHAEDRGRRPRAPTAPPLAAAGASRTPLEPGWNMFSAEQDVELGRQAAIEAEQQVPLLNDARVDDYLNGIGRRLAAKTPGHQFPYSYKAVNDHSINAFALPGGSIFINRGVIEAATSEAQLAGVMAHEASHVALRHGTNQASKASVAQMPLAILGGLLGGNSTAAALTQLGAGFTVNSILLKYSRDAESQADLLGTQILYDAGYDSRAMAQFFETLQAQDRGSSRVAFFNSHPNPDRRVENATAEAAKLGGSQGSSPANAGDFDQIKRRLRSLAEPRPDRLLGPGGLSGARPAPAGQVAEGSTTYQNKVLRIDHPDSWMAHGQGDAVTIAPPGGMISDGSGNQAMAYGVLVNLYEPLADHRYSRQLQGPGFGPGPETYLEDATDQLVQDLRQSNRNLRLIRRHEPIDVSGRSGLSTYLSNDSPAEGGDRETNWLVTVPHAEGLLFFVFTAPEREFQRYEGAFYRMLASAQVK